MFTKHVVVEDGCIEDNNLKQHNDLSFYLSTWRLNQSNLWSIFNMQIVKLSKSKEMKII